VYFRLKVAIKQASVGIPVTVVQILRWHRARQSLAHHADSLSQLQVHFAHHLAFAQMRSHQMTRAWFQSIMAAARTPKQRFRA
jgi:hypothetical protein